MLIGFAGVGFIAYRRRNQGSALTAAQVLTLPSLRRPPLTGLLC